MRQLRLFKREKTEFGGSLLKNKRKNQRPLTTKAPIFITFKGDISESGSLLKCREQIDDELYRWTEKFEVKLHKHCINHDHLHLCVEITSAEGYKNFVRTFTGRTAKLTKIKWIQRPHTDLVTKGKHFDNVIGYIIKNHEEAIGQRPYTKRRAKVYKRRRVKGD